MFKQKLKKSKLIKRVLVAIPIIVLAASFVAGLNRSTEVSAATNSTVNFQARLLTAAGNVVPDGFYNVEFKLYDASSGGTALWTETRTGGNTARVVNGYLTVNLGSVTAFGNIHWDRELWLTMNIGGIGTPSWDGEMNPRLKLTAVPYAFRAGQLALQTGANTSTLGFDTQTAANSILLPDESGTVCLQASGNCGFVAGSVADFIQNQSASQQATSSFWISGTGRADIALQAPSVDTPNAAALNIGTTNATGVTLGKSTGSGSTTIQGGTGGIDLASGGEVNIAGTDDVNITSTGFIELGTDTNVTGDLTISGSVGIGTTTPGRAFDLVVNNTTTDAPPFRILQEGAGDASLEFQDTNGKSFFVGMDASDGGAFKIASSTSAATSAIDEGHTSESCCNSSTSGSSEIWATKVTIGAAGGTVSSISLYTSSVDAGLPEGQVALYTHDATNDLPQDLIAASGAQTLTSGWNSFSVSAAVNASTTYWLAYNFEGSTTRHFGSVGGARTVGYGEPFGTWPDPAADLGGTTFTSSGTATPLYVTIIPAGAVDSFDGVNLLEIGDSGAVTFRNSTDSAAAFRILNAGDVPIFNIDTANDRVYVGNPTTDDTGALLILDSKDDTGGTTTDPTGVAGGMYYNVDSGKFRCYEGGAWKDCITNVGGTAFIQGGNSFNATAVLGTNDAFNLQLETQNVVRATFDTSNNLYLGNGATAASPNNFTIQGTGSSTTGVAGGSLTLQGGNATTGNANGGNVTLTGGTGIGTGARGLVVINTPTVATTTADASCGATTAANCTIAAATVNNTSSVVVGATTAGVTITMPDPTITTAGRIFYFTAANGSTDFALALNAGGTLITISMRANSTATLIWNGSDWTAAGASSSTTLQSAYDSTLTSAGGAEIVLNNSASSNGLTVRNNATNPIIGGGLLEVQTSIGTNLFSVNNNISELVANGGAEDSSTFSTNWQSFGTSTVTRNTTSGQYATGTAGTQFASTSANSGVRNNLATNPTQNTNYLVSFTAKLASGSPAFTDLTVQYTPNGGTTLVTCAQNQTVVSTDWTRITCEVNTDGTSVSNADLLVYQVADPGAPTRTVYIDNLSMTLADDAGGIPNNVQIGGGIYGGAPTLFTLDRSSAPPVANDNTTYLGSMYYDTVSGRIQCYEADGWGACGSAPDNIVTLTPEYSGAVLNGNGVGTMSADFCSNQAGVLSVNTSFCASGISRNFYRWTSPQASTQTYSIYVSYKLPNTFKSFLDSNTIKLTALTDDMTDGEVGYQVFRSTGSAVTSCGSETIVTTPSADTWYQTPFGGDEAACGFQASDNVIFKINVRARNNASVYVENLDFVYLNF